MTKHNTLRYLGQIQSVMLIQVLIICAISKVICVTTIGPNDDIGDYIDGTSLNTDWADSENEDIQILVDDVPSLSLPTLLPLGNVTFPWDKTTMSAKEYQNAYCAKACIGEEVVSLPRPGTCLPIECFPCDCDKPRCQDYGTCCPDYQDLLLVNSSSPVTSANSSSISCQRASCPTTNDDNIINSDTDQSWNLKLGCERSDNSDFLYIRSCPSNYSRSDVKTRCEDDTPFGEEDLDTFLHVTDNVTWHIYFNMHCATCNAVTHFIYWDLSVKCRDYMKVYQANTLQELFTLSLAEDSRCNISQKTPARISRYKCSETWFGSTIIASCNMTGAWNVYDEEIEQGCGDMSAIAERVRYKNRGRYIYQNLFCALCNADWFINIPTHCSDVIFIKDLSEDDIFNPLLPFSMLLNFNSQTSLLDDSEEYIFNKCSSDTEWTSPDYMCFPLQCSPGKVLTNGSCSTAISLISGLVYMTRILYLPRDSAQTDPRTNITQIDGSFRMDGHDEFLDLFQNKLDVIFSDVVKEANITLTFIFSDYHKMNSSRNFFHQLHDLANSSQLGLSDQFQIKGVLLDGFLLVNARLTRNEAEQYLLDELITNSIHISVDRNISLTLTPILTTYRRDHNIDCPSLNEQMLSCVQTILIRPHFENCNYTFNLDKQNAILLEPQLTCPFISFNSTQFLFDNNNSNYLDINPVTLHIGDVSVIISEIGELNMLSMDEDGTLKVCQQLLDKKIKKSFKDKTRSNRLLIMSQYILTLVCLIASILCLAITLLTYSLFSKLRSVAGKNNMFLCGSLMLAQSSLLAASHVQQNGYLCIFLAILNHFLWLSMFCWCFTSCLHMFITFSAKTRSIRATASTEHKYIIKRAVACSVVPALIVIAVVVINYVTSQGRRIGYGQTTCFLDSPALVGATLVTPVCLILFCNVCFFTITVIKINTILKLQTENIKSDDRKNLYVYVKLSSMTGMFWILTIISEATNNDPLRFVYIFLNGLQGVFIFLSYICNKRVIRLYSRALRLEKDTSTSTSEKNTAAKVMSYIRHGEYLERNSIYSQRLSIKSERVETVSSSLKT